ncbi:BlaI/MecI/CopY family transcriptional regulator [Peribacillus frigoritolerans]|uniref:BlaI/MecI/CopY family transcriptional regulator n=1 Tax=Peribacillus frigoritolerans TaxID=450367 RepID=UPI0007BEAD8A|nr:BlaI/MecI/CopY family transcriptional regulator [Peribacillus frigoritolerans]USK67046.1 BlaI/MecI/CopY family transcriptional regulator [Peribacillus frigoritolerans]
MSKIYNELLPKILGPLELEVMKILWSKKEATVQGVLAELNKQNDYAYTTIMTILNRLDKKGILTRNKVGKGYLYKARYNQGELVQQTTSKKVEQLLGNYGDIALAQFVDVVDHNPGQLKKLKLIIQSLEKGEKS